MKKLWINEREYVLFNEVKSNISNEIATRNRSIDFYSILQNLPDPDPVLRKQGKDIRIYRDLLSDPHVWACVQSRKSGVLSLEWEIDRGKAKSKQAQVIENFFKSIDLNTLISEILNSVFFGFQPIEIMWKPNGTYTLPSQIKAKPPEWFVFDDDNNLKFKTKSNFNGELLPPRKFLCPQYEPTYENPYGERTLSRIFWNVILKKGGLKFWIKFTEKYGMPFLIGKHPRGTGKEDSNNFANMLEAMVHDAIAIIPDDSTIEIQEATKTSSAEIYERLVDKMNAEISKAILGQTLTTEIGNKGSYSASKTHFDVRKDIINADKKLVERTLNQLIYWIYELNFAGQSEIPVFTMYEEEDVDLNLAQRDKILFDAGVKFTKKYLMRTYGFEEDDIEVSNLETKVIKPEEIPPASQEKSFKEFKETQSEFPDQQIIDDFIDSFSAEELQEQAKNIFGSVMELVNNASSYEEIQEKLSEQGLETSQIEKMLEKIIFISEIWGRLSVNEENANLK
ncbi:MAG TPA: DUF935 family protein [Candidatus Gastranaerophilales bacterium]|nr:DUF935 family protein [Candidatus Gastranaerophilales bacterium]